MDPKKITERLAEHDRQREIMQAYADGKTVELKSSADTKWAVSLNPGFDSWRTVDYRIKPEPKEIWVNEYKTSESDHDPVAYATSVNAKRAAAPSALRTAVKYVEAID